MENRKHFYFFKIIFIFYCHSIISMESMDVQELMQDAHKESKQEISININEIVSKKQKYKKNNSNLVKFIDIKTDSDLVRCLPPEIWYGVIEYLNLNDKNDLRAILNIFAPRIGVPDNIAKLIATNLSIYATLRATDLDNWQYRIENHYESWGNIKNFKNFKNNKSFESVTKINEYIKLINKDFINKKEEYKIISLAKEKELKKFWKNSLDELEKRV